MNAESMEKKTESAPGYTRRETMISRFFCTRRRRKSRSGWGGMMREPNTDWKMETSSSTFFQRIRFTLVSR